MVKWYKLVFKQIQPVHIGYRKWGVANETRIFILGQTMWGALTNAYGIKKRWGKEDFKNDKNRAIFERITCFYPALQKNNGNEYTPLFPNYKNGEFYLGDYSEGEFRYKFIETFVSTAILQESRHAKEGSLHELDVILPKSKDGKLALYWTGLIGLDDNNDVHAFLKKDLEIFIGGDNRYGLGLVRLEEIKEEENLGVWNLNKEGRITYNYNEDGLLKNFLQFNNSIKFEGGLELIAEFNFQKNRPLIEKDNVEYFITPGSKIKNTNLQFYMLRKGKFVSYNNKQ